MKKLNLHGKRHYEVDRIVENFIIDTYNRDELPTEIITGNSKKMRDIVETVLERHGLKSYSKYWIDGGSIIVYESI